MDCGSRELAAALVDGGVDVERDDHGYSTGTIIIDVPTVAYELVSDNPTMKQTLVKAAKAVALGHVSNTDDPGVRLRVKLLDGDRGWQDIAREMILNQKGNNQGLISEMVAQRDRTRNDMIVYNETKYASQSEVRIAQELETRQVLFFPLALGIRADTGVNYRDHREVDFLVCEDGTWGILECSWHVGRYEKDSEKNTWFKKSGILCVQHYTAERCYKEPARVVDEFLSILRQHKR